MRCFLYLFSIVLVGCSSTRVDSEIAVDEMESNERAYYQDWVGGAPGSGMGALLYIPTAMLDGGAVVDAYFKGMGKTHIEFFGKDKAFVRVRFAALPSTDLIMDADTVNESRNRIPDDPTPIPLAEGEAFIVIENAGQRSNIKLTGLKSTGRIEYPSAPPVEE